MPRVKLSQERLKETRRQNIGRIIIFCEGTSEKNYMNFFSDTINNPKNKYNKIVIELKEACGNAITVLKFANNFLITDENRKEYFNYEKYLIFDCDDPQDIQSVIIEAINNKNGYKVLVSNPFFETWLLMHFENVTKSLSKLKTARRLEKHLSLKEGEYKKSDPGLTRKIITSDERNIEKAIDYAKCLEKKYKHENKDFSKSIKSMNPYSNIYKLVEQFMIEIS
jgi:hypothetical protein